MSKQTTTVSKHVLVHHNSYFSHWSKSSDLCRVLINEQNQPQLPHIRHNHLSDEVSGLRGYLAEVLLRIGEVIGQDVSTRLLRTLIQEGGDTTQQYIHHHAHTPVGHTHTHTLFVYRA